MPCDPAKVAKLNAALDDYMRARQEPDFYDDEDEDEDEEDILNPLAAPQKFGDGEHGGPPEKIHGEGDK
jgi:hypothetical protein